MSEYGSDDDPDEMKFGPGQRSNGGQRGDPKEMEEEMREYMEQMDRELAKTSIGKSFVTNKEQVNEYLSSELSPADSNSPLWPRICHKI